MTGCEKYVILLTVLFKIIQILHIKEEIPNVSWRADHGHSIIVGIGRPVVFPFLPVEEKTPSFRPAPSDGICTDLLYHSGV